MGQKLPRGAYTNFMFFQDPITWKIQGKSCFFTAYFLW